MQAGLENKIEISDSKSASQLAEAFELLNHNLEEILSAYRLLQSVLEQEKKLMIEVNSDELLANNATKEACLIKLKNLEQQRQGHAKFLASLLRLSLENPTLKELAQGLSGMRKERLMSFHKSLELTVLRVYEMNKENEEYAKSALSTLNGALGEIKQTIAPKPTYGRMGKMKDTSERSGHFVSKEG